MPDYFLDHGTNREGEVCIFIEAGSALPVSWKPAGQEAIVIIREDGTDRIATLSPDALTLANDARRILAVEVDRENRVLIGENWIPLAA